MKRGQYKNRGTWKLNSAARTVPLTINMTYAIPYYSGHMPFPIFLENPRVLRVDGRMPRRWAPAPQAPVYAACMHYMYHTNMYIVGRVVDNMQELCITYNARPRPLCKGP